MRFRRNIPIVLVTVIVSILGLGSVRPAVAAATEIRSATATSIFGELQLRVIIASEQRIERVEARIRKVGEDEVIATFGDFVITGPRPASNIYNATIQPIDLPEVGDYTIDVSAWDADGVRTDKSDVGVIRKRLATRFIGLTVTPTVVDVENDEVTVTGRLLYTAADGIERGLSGEPVFAGTPQREFVTDADGRFAGKADLGGAWGLTVRYPGDSVYGEASPSSVNVKYQTLNTRLTVDATPNPAIMGGKALVKGMLERESATGQWAGLPDKPVRIWFESDATDTRDDLGEVRTGPDGVFQLSAPVTGSGNWFAQFNTLPVPTHPGYTETNIRTGRFVANYRTAITGFDAGPEPVAKGTSLTLKGRVVRLAPAAGPTAYVSGGHVTFEFSADGKKWVPDIGGTTNQDGFFSTSIRAGRDGYWRMVYNGLTRDLPWPTGDLLSSSGSDHVDVRQKTTISLFNAAPEPVRKGATLTVSGTLKHFVWSSRGPWGSWEALSGQTVFLYLQPRGARTWTYMATARTDRYGRVRRGFKASRDGTWMARYKGNTTYMPGSSAADYVDVR